MPQPSDRTPLLAQNGAVQEYAPRTLSHRVSGILKPEDQPGWLQSLRFFFFGSYLNIFLVFVPLSAISHHLNWDAALRFSFSFIAIMPLAALLGTATEQLSLKLGQTLSGLLNASFGNAVEIIVGIVALQQNELRIVQTSLLGSILSNLLLVLGCSFLAGGLKYSESNFQITGTQASSSLMMLACITLVIPAAYHGAQSRLENLLGTKFMSGTEEVLFSATQVVDGSDLDERAGHGLRVISRGTSLLLLAVYVAYLIFQLKTHRKLFMSEEELLAESGEAPAHDREATAVEEDEEEPMMNTPSALIGLVIATVVTSFCADYLVASIEETSERYGLPKPFIGLILIPIVANAAEHVTAVWMAMKGKMELTIGVCVGSSIQIAAFVIPLLVIVGWITHHDLTLFFADFETIVLFVSVILVNSLIQDGKSNYMEGLMLVTLYLIIALTFWVS